MFDRLTLAYLPRRETPYQWVSSSTIEAFVCTKDNMLGVMICICRRGDQTRSANRLFQTNFQVIVTTPTRWFTTISVQVFI